MNRRTQWAAALAVAALAAAGFWATRPDRVTGPHATSSSEAGAGESAAPVGYVDDRLCASCHEEESAAWLQSHHAQAMAEATPATVLGDFDDAAFTHQGATSRFFRQDGKYYVRTDGPDGVAGDFEVAYTFGVAPLQQYLIAMPGGRLQALQIAWDRSRGTWFHLRPDETTPPGDVLHWTGSYQTANTMCIVCHTTGFEKHYDPASDTFASRWAAPNVGCQACHGPGERHLQWARRNREGGAGRDGAGDRYGLTVDTGTADARREVESCAPCHAHRSELASAPQPGGALLDAYLPSLLTEDLYHADGQQLGEVFVYGSFRQSRMYATGVSCTHCHDAHSGKPVLEGNALCGQCHAPEPNPEFASAAGRFDSPEHHFHEPGSAGAQCVSCHMPAKTYMQVQARPDHSLQVPRPDLSVKIGTPNACNGCHTDRSAQWAAERVAEWYGPKRRREAHYGEALAAARAGGPGAAEGLVALAADAAQPAIVRATALEALRDDPVTGLAVRLAATHDRDPEVRAAAAAGLASVPAASRLEGLSPLLQDPVRAVRIGAAHSLSSLPAAAFDTDRRAAFDAALGEYVAAQSVSLDMPGARFNLGVVHQNTGRTDLAEGHYLAALKLDPDFTPSRANLAVLYNGASRNAEAERVLVDGLARNPELGELQYSLGLLRVETGRLPEAEANLAAAARLLPGRPRVHYNYGLLLQRLGRARAAEAALLNADRLEGGNPETLYALAVLYAQEGQRESAEAWVARLMAADPENVAGARLAESLRTKR